MENSTTTPKHSEEDTVVLDLSPGTLQNIAARFPVDIQLEPPIELLQDALQQSSSEGTSTSSQKGSSEGTSSQHTGSSEYSQDSEYQPTGSDSDLKAFQSPPKKKQKKIDGYQKWNGTIKQPLPDKEFSSRMHNIREFLLDGKEPEGMDQKALNKFRYAAHSKYVMKEGKLFFKAKAKSGELEVVCDKKEQFRIMKCIHSGIGVSKESRALGGHLGMNTLQTEVASRYYWPCVTQDVKKFIKSCKECQCSKLSNLEKTKQTLHPVKVPQGIWQQIGIDLVGPLPQSPEGHEYMLTVIDYFSK